MANIIIREARQAEIASLISIIPRSFDSDAFLNQIFPHDSALIQEWWKKVYTEAIRSPAYHILVATDETAVMGVLTLHFCSSDEAYSKPDGLCTLAPLTEDHGENLQIALQQQVERRIHLLRRNPNFMIDLMAIDKEYQGVGLGRRLVERACQIADVKNAVIFLQTSKAEIYYLKLGLGFVSAGEIADGNVIRLPSRIDGSHPALQ